MLPFYKTFPFMDYYKNEDAFAKDLAMRQTGLPADLSQSKAAGALSVQQRAYFLTVNSADADADTEGTKDSGRYKDMIL